MQLKVPYLSLHIVSRDNIANGPEGGCLDSVAVMQEQLNKPRGNAGPQGVLNVLVGSVRQVGKGPAGVCQDFSVARAQ
jgi:hypothetical protein